MSVPIAIIAIIVKGWTYTIMALITTAIYSVVVDLLSFLPNLTDDKLVAVICGGILYGLGASLMVKARMSAGGTDLLAKVVITKLKTISLGQLYMIIDGSVVVIATIAYGNIESGIYAILAIGVCSLVTDQMHKGFNKAQMFLIFATKNIDKIADDVMFTMNRGVTALYGAGKYTNEGREILMVVVSPHETPELKAIVRKHDPHAFIALVPANEIIGEGFEDTDITKTKQEEKADDINKAADTGES